MRRRSLAGPGPIFDSLTIDPGFSIMLGEELGLVIDHIWGMGFERFRDPRMQLLARAAQQAAMRRVLHQRVLESINRVGRRAALEDQLGSDELIESSLQLVVGKAGDTMQQFVGKLPPDRGTDLRYASD